MITPEQRLLEAIKPSHFAAPRKALDKLVGWAYDKDEDTQSIYGWIGDRADDVRIFLQEVSLEMNDS